MWPFVSLVAAAGAVCGSAASARTGLHDRRNRNSLVHEHPLPSRSIFFEIERRHRLGKSELLVPGMGSKRVFLVPEGLGPVDEHERLVSRQACDLRGLHEVALDEAVIVGIGGVRTARVVNGDVRHRLLANHLCDLLIGVRCLAPEEEKRVAGIRDG